MRSIGGEHVCNQIWKELELDEWFGKFKGVTEQQIKLFKSLILPKPLSPPTQEVSVETMLTLSDIQNFSRFSTWEDCGRENPCANLAGGQTMKVELKVIKGPLEGQNFLFIKNGNYLVGRSTDAEIKLPPDDKTSSRNHFRLEIANERCTLIDLSSRNGTYVNGLRIGPDDPEASKSAILGDTFPWQVLLKDGSEIKAGKTTFIAHIEGLHFLSEI